MKDRKPYCIYGFYDSETNNVASLKAGVIAYPVLHQFGKLLKSVGEITPKNVKRCVEVTMYRHVFEICSLFDSIADSKFDYVPVVCVHNLGFDMFALSDWLNSKNVRVLAKSSVKPMSFTILDDNDNPRLVLWDTLSFSMKSLANMGEECGYPKLQGDWDYDLQRTPETFLTEREVDYAKHDIYVLACWLSYFLAHNPDIDESRLGLNVVTKTGVVRERRRLLFGKLKTPFNGTVGNYWHMHNISQLPKTDDELYTMHACTRGGFTFCASKAAGYPYNLPDSKMVVGYDANSQHPAQMCSKVYPQNFKKASKRELELAIDIVANVTLNMMLRDLQKPFPVAFNAKFEFTNLRISDNSVFNKCGIACLASARFAKNIEVPEELRIDNEAAALFIEAISKKGYRDICTNGVFEFGKLASADKAFVFLTELEFWNVCQVYEFDNVKPVSGYITTQFCKPSDMSVLSVVHFFNAKNVFKYWMEKYFNGDGLTGIDELRQYVSSSIVDAMASGTISDDEVKRVYQGLKANLNSLFGIEATNECREDMILTQNGIEYKGGITINNLPKHPKSWYQFGQRIVGWSRVAQIVHMLLAEPYIENVVNGDTDSLKMVVKKENIPLLEKSFERYSNAMKTAFLKTTSRVVKSFGVDVSNMLQLGFYVKEFETANFCAAWNKAYCNMAIDARDGKAHFKFTLAGIPSGGETGVNAVAGYLYHNAGWSFEGVCNLLLGYNVNFDYSVTKLNMRKPPDWGSFYNGNVRDYMGNIAHVAEPNAMGICPMQKTIGSTGVFENAVNCAIAKRNNPDLNDVPVLVKWENNHPVIINLENGKVIFDG